MLCARDQDALAVLFIEPYEAHGQSDVIAVHRVVDSVFGTNVCGDDVPGIDPDASE